MQTEDPMTRTLDTPAFAEAGVASGKAMVAHEAPIQSREIFLTAQRVAVPREMAKVRAAMSALCAYNGLQYVYGWDVNDRKRNRKIRVEGGTIILANDLVREWGNCSLKMRLVDGGSSWHFYAQFADIEKGYLRESIYQQRKGQEIGMEDAQRAQDLIFQVGQSKAARNVVRHALQSLWVWCIEEAKRSVLADVEKSPDNARKWILKKLESLGIDKKRVEIVYGRTVDNWTVPDMAKIYTEVQSILDNMVTADDIFPDEHSQKETTGSADKAPKKKADEKAAPPPAQDERKETPGSPPGPSETASGADGAASTERPVDAATGAIRPCGVFMQDGRQLTSTTDTALKEGDPFAFDGKEYTIIKRRQLEGEPPAYFVKPAEAGEQTQPAANPQAKRKSMFRKGGA